jgi:hypothetical protein
MTTRENKVEMTTYIIEFENHQKRRITVPSSWKVTFGPATAGSNKPTTGYNHKMPMAIRFYESKDKQRAIFTDVVSFRDTSIIFEEEVVNTKIKEGFVEVDGVRKATSFSATTKEWVSPDSIVKDEPRLLMPTDEEMDLED